ncbi:hypothetical protein WJX82_009925 [Trebouxia sp. C0006]
MCTSCFEVEGERIIAGALSIAETLQSAEHTFLAGGKVPAFVELLKFKSCSVGAKIWGVISDVMHHGLIISLPDGLRGYVSADEASDMLSGLKDKTQRPPALTELFQAALTIDSIQSGTPTTACVTSVEDHGYTVSFGKGMKGFLSKRTQPNGGQGEGAKGLKPGMLVECVAPSSKGKPDRAIKVSAAPNVIAEAVTVDYEGLSIGALMPGALVEAHIQHVVSDGLVLSFLTFFTGTVDQFHLAQVCPGGDWKKQYSKDEKVRARIVYVDPTSKQIKLSLQPELVDLTVRKLPSVGQVFEDLVVKRIDEGLGLILEVPSEPAVTPGFVHISNVGDTKVDKLQQAYRVGQKVKGRVIGARHLDGLSVLSLKPTVVEQQVASINEVKAGSLMTGTISSIADYGMLVSLAPGIRAMVPTLHTANTVGKRSSSKYKVGQEVTGRILEVDAAKKRVSMTLKKLLCSNKLPVITTFQDAEPGVQSHGYITGIKPYGIFVSFFGGMKGLAHTAELPLAPTQAAKDAYQVGQVVKCRVLSTDFSHQRLKLSLMGKKSGTEGPAGGVGDPLKGLQPGDIVEGSVREIERTEEEGESVPSQYIVDIKGGAHGPLGAEHLADHPSAVTALQGALQVGSPLGPLLVLERVEGSGIVKLSRKSSLITAAASLPKAISDVKEALLVPGYITNVTNDACYVRFLGQLTGRAGLAQLADLFVSDPSRHFHVGQSVRAQVVQVDSGKERFTVTLKQSLAGASDAAYLQSLLKDLEYAEKLRVAADPDVANQVQWDRSFAIGSLAEASVHELKDYGVVFDFAAHADVLGLAALHQVLGPPAVPGTALQARILDISKDTGIVDVSVKPSLVDVAVNATPSSKGQNTEEEDGDKAAKKMKKGSKKRKAEEALDAAHAADKTPKVSRELVTAVVELVKDDYLVLSLPKHNQAVGFAAVTDFNLQSQEGRSPFKLGQQVQARIAALPSAETGGRLVMHLPLLTDAQAAKKGSGKGPAANPGQLLKGKISAIHSAHMDVTLQSGQKGRVCLCEVQDAELAVTQGGKPFEGLSEGQNVEAVCLGQMEGFEGRKMGLLDLSLRPAVLTAAANNSNVTSLRLRVSKLKLGQPVYGYVQEVAEQHLVVQISSAIKGRVSVLDSAEEPEQLSEFTQRFKEGQPIQCRVSQVDRNHNQADLSLRELHSSSKLSSATAATAPEGSLLLGQVVTASAGLVRVHVGRRTYGKVAVTDIRDGWIDNPAEGVTQGMYVKCCVVGKTSGTKEDALQLSLQASKGASWPGQGRAGQSPGEGAVTSVDQLKEGQQVHGYVKSVAKVGVFVTIGRGIEARVKLGQLSATFVEDPAVAFPVGKLVKGRVVSVTGNRVEMTLKEGQGGSWTDMGDLKKGDVVKGRIKRLEAFGAFVELHNSTLTGLAHISEVSDDFIKTLEDSFQVGQGVRAIVLDVDTAQRRLSLGLKASYFDGAGDAEEAVDGKAEAESDIEEEMAAMESADEDEEDDERPLAEALGLDTTANAEASSEDDDAADDQSDAASSAEDDADIDDLDDLEDESDAASSASGSDAEEDEDEGPAKPSSSAGLANKKMKKQKPGDVASGLGSVGWEASDEEDERPAAVPASEAEPATLSKTSKAQKRRQKDAHEQQVRERELARVSESGSQPESAEDFERLVMGEPNSSMLWIQYMAFLISLGEIEKARGVAERGLATINYREEGEKFNIWQAWLNLENMYGSPTPDEAVTRLFQKALPYCNAKKLYLALLDILERTNKDELAEQTLKAVCRKFSTSAKVWLRHISWLLTKDRADAARKVMDKSFDVLPQRKHIKVISHTAIQEFKVGSGERGRSMFESCLRNYPARLDVWSQYLDQEIKLGEKQRIEALFERAVHLQLPPKKMKFLFKRYLQYEQEHGDATAVANVKKQALDFVQQHM